MIGLEDKDRKSTVNMLQALLASEYVLAVKTRKFHRNVQSEYFMMFHEMFGEMYDHLNGQSDEIAERIRQLGEFPQGTMSEFLKSSFLNESVLPSPGCHEMVKELIADNDKMVAQMRVAIPKAEAVKDFGTMDLITKWMELHEKDLYFLRSHVK